MVPLLNKGGSIVAFIKDLQSMEKLDEFLDKIVSVTNKTS